MSCRDLQSSVCFPVKGFGEFSLVFLVATAALAMSLEV